MSQSAVEIADMLSKIVADVENALDESFKRSKGYNVNSYFLNQPEMFITAVLNSFNFCRSSTGVKNYLNNALLLLRRIRPSSGLATTLRDLMPPGEFDRALKDSLERLETTRVSDDDFLIVGDFLIGGPKNLLDTVVISPENELIYREELRKLEGYTPSVSDSLDAKIRINRFTQENIVKQLSGLHGKTDQGTGKKADVLRSKLTAAQQELETLRELMATQKPTTPEEAIRIFNLDPKSFAKVTGEIEEQSIKISKLAGKTDNVSIRTARTLRKTFDSMQERAQLLRLMINHPEKVVLIQQVLQGLDKYLRLSCPEGQMTAVSERADRGAQVETEFVSILKGIAEKLSGNGYQLECYYNITTKYSGEARNRVKAEFDAIYLAKIGEAYYVVKIFEMKSSVQGLYGTGSSSDMTKLNLGITDILEYVAVKPLELKVSRTSSVLSNVPVSKDGTLQHSPDAIYLDRASFQLIRKTRPVDLDDTDQLLAPLDERVPGARQKMIEYYHLEPNIIDGSYYTNTIYLCCDNDSAGYVPLISKTTMRETLDFLRELRFSVASAHHGEGVAERLRSLFKRVEILQPGVIDVLIKHNFRETPVDQVLRELPDNSQIRINLQEIVDILTTLHRELYGPQATIEYLNNHLIGRNYLYYPTSPSNSHSHIYFRTCDVLN